MSGPSRVAIVTGGTKGLGRAISLRLSKLGFSVKAFYFHDNVAAEQLNADAREHVLDIKTVQIDLSDSKAIEHFFETNADLKSLEILVNNASPHFTAEKFQKWDLKKFDELFSVNVRAPFQLMQLAFPFMKARNSGKIINILSSYTLLPPPIGTSGYISAKFALWALTQAAAAEYKRFNILVNAISPNVMDCGVVTTWPQTLKELVLEQMPQKRFIPIENVVAVVESLVLENGSALSGANIPVTDINL